MRSCGILRQMARHHLMPILEDSPMRADVYQKLHEFNLHIDQGMATLRNMAQIKKVSAREIEHRAEYF